MKLARHKVIVFLGPSLPVREAKQLLRADYRPPARQGDLFRAIDARPDVIVLIDGVFESAPSVWHHELLAAHASGIALLGAHGDEVIFTSGATEANNLALFGLAGSAPAQLAASSSARRRFPCWRR